MNDSRTFLVREDQQWTSWETFWAVWGFGGFFLGGLAFLTWDWWGTIGHVIWGCLAVGLLLLLYAEFRLTKAGEQSGIVVDDHGLQILNGTRQSTSLPWAQIAEITDDAQAGAITLRDLSGASHRIPSPLDNVEEVLRLLGERAAVVQRAVQFPVRFRRKALWPIIRTLSLVLLAAFVAALLLPVEDSVLHFLPIFALVGCLGVLFTLPSFLIGQRRLLVESTHFTFHKGSATTSVPFSAVSALRVGYLAGRRNKSGSLPALYVIVTLTDGRTYALRVFGTPVFDIYRALRAGWRSAGGRTIQ